MTSQIRVNSIITDHNITVNYNGTTHIISRTDPLANKIITALKSGQQDQIPELVSTAKRIEKYGQGNFVVENGRVKINGFVVPDHLSQRILAFQTQGLPFEPLIKFAQNLQQNPSFRAINELFQFLENNHHPITDNGCFIAYKKVKSDFKDGWTGTIDNSIGSIVQMPRNQVNEDSTKTCSFGLHVANWDYAHNKYSAGDDAIMLEVEVNPQDVVAIPQDYDQAKIRVCKYRVLGVVKQSHSDGTQLRITKESVIEQNTNNWYEDDSEDNNDPYDTENYYQNDADDTDNYFHDLKNSQCNDNDDGSIDVDVDDRYVWSDVWSGDDFSEK